MVHYDIPQAADIRQQHRDVNGVAGAGVNIYAAPFDALAYNGMQINGSMEVSQENGAANVTVTSGADKYIADGWRVKSTGQTVTGVIASSIVGSGFTNYLQTIPSAANAAPAAGDILAVYQNIEGYRVARLGWGTANAQPLTIGFWVWGYRVGAYSGSVNGGGGRSYVFTFNLNSQYNWEYKTVTILGDVAGTWMTNNGTGLAVSFTLMAGTTHQNAAGAWVAGNKYAATGTINAVASMSDTMLITGVVVLPGFEAPSAARSPLILRPYDQELVTCKRYYEKSSGAHQHCINGTGTWGGDPVFFKVEKRAAPTVSGLNISYGNASNLVFNSPSTYGCNWTVLSLQPRGYATLHRF